MSTLGKRENELMEGNDIYKRMCKQAEEQECEMEDIDNTIANKKAEIAKMDKEFSYMKKLKTIMMGDHRSKIAEMDKLITEKNEELTLLDVHSTKGKLQCMFTTADSVIDFVNELTSVLDNNNVDSISSVGGYYSFDMFTDCGAKLARQNADMDLIRDHVAKFSGNHMMFSICTQKNKTETSEKLKNFEKHKMETRKNFNKK
jgi:hypothetical protein